MNSTPEQHIEALTVLRNAGPGMWIAPVLQALDWALPILRDSTGQFTRDNWADGIPVDIRLQLLSPEELRKAFLRIVQERDDARERVLTWDLANCGSASIDSQPSSNSDSASPSKEMAPSEWIAALDAMTAATEPISRFANSHHKDLSIDQVRAFNLAIHRIFELARAREMSNCSRCPTPRSDLCPAHARDLAREDIRIENGSWATTREETAKDLDSRAAELADQGHHSTAATMRRSAKLLLEHAPPIDTTVANSPEPMLTEDIAPRDALDQMARHLESFSYPLGSTPENRRVMARSIRRTLDMLDTLESAPCPSPGCPSNATPETQETFDWAERHRSALRMALERETSPTMRAALEWATQKADWMPLHATIDALKEMSAVRRRLANPKRPPRVITEIRLQTIRRKVKTIRRTIEDWQESAGIEAERTGMTPMYRERSAEKATTLFQVIGLLSAMGFNSDSSPKPSDERSPSP